MTNICNASQKRSPDVATTNEGLNIINNNYNIVGSNPLATGFSIDDSAYILGEDNLADNSSFIDSLYYIDNEIGIDYTAYLRSYRVSPTSITRQGLREQIFQFDTNPRSLTSILRQGRSRLPFIIYRYQI